MPFFQFNKKTYGAALVAGVLALFFVVGCETSQKKDAPAKLEIQAGSSVAGESIAGQKYIHGIDINKENKSIEVRITGNKELAYYSIKQPFPFAICVYLPETLIKPGLIPGSIKDDAIGGLKLTYADQKQTTAKLEILLNQDLSYEVMEEGALLRVVLSPPLPGERSLSKEMTTAPGTSPPSQSIPSVPVVVSDTPAVMTGIAFNTLESGRSDIRLETSHPIKYEMTRRGDRILNLNLVDTKIPAAHLRPLLTRYFNSAVEGIEPKNRPDNAKDSVIEITVREQVPYRISQDQNVITLVFEPSQVAPPLFDKAQKQLSNAMVTKPHGMAETPPIVAGEKGVSQTSLVKKAEKNLIPGQASPRYTGEKIKLDFYDTDIKNVFRILRSVSGLNFAIDKDVQGKVTMTLEEPVPWDQVLDLVLKMNGLGKKNEGNVIRIATIATLQNEEVILQDAIAAQKKSLEQKESFEPLVTQYIPINYSDAEADIKPHIEQILSKDRGKISVDQRTNMIILTDTQAKVDQAQEIIFRLDTVTPQIMIEAKVVEVTKEFARSIGVGWNLSNATAITSTFVDDFNVSVNKPTGGGLKTDFSFFRLFGSSAMALNAQLEASEQQGDVKIVSSPRILTLDNKKAKIKQGKEIAYLERDDAGGSSVKFKNVDLLLEVTPHVTPDKRISMTIYLTKNDVSGETTTGVPTLATNEAETELLVNNNDTVVIGGVVKTTNTDTSNGLPFLSGIPIIGTLFGTDTKKDDRNELLIFLTPSIVQLEQKRNTEMPVRQ
ncbi:MAG: type IV pilus secretin PilQ [Proteobacteria bacterium]|nr:type IV pilus secretin PilQ [Desulfobacula sp.]MBU4131387.1 type IV pilus secretin PilQ [Pseudomonadota bacterium]